MTNPTLTAEDRKHAKEFVDRVMGARAGDGVSPAAAAAMLAEAAGLVLTPRQVWNLWIDGDEE